MSSTDVLSDPNGTQKSYKYLEDSDTREEIQSDLTATPEVDSIYKISSNDDENEGPDSQESLVESDKRELEQPNINATSVATLPTNIPSTDAVKKTEAALVSPKSLEESDRGKSEEKTSVAPLVTLSANIPSTDILNKSEASLVSSISSEETDRGVSEQPGVSTASVATLTTNILSTDILNKPEASSEKADRGVSEQSGVSTSPVVTLSSTNVLKEQSTDVLKESETSLEFLKSLEKAERGEAKQPAIVAPVVMLSTNIPSTAVLKKPEASLEYLKFLEKSDGIETERPDITAVQESMLLSLANPSQPSTVALGEPKNSVDPHNSIEKSDARNSNATDTTTKPDVSNVPSSDAANLAKESLESPKNFGVCCRNSERPKDTAASESYMLSSYILPIDCPKNSSASEVSPNHLQSFLTLKLGQSYATPQVVKRYNNLAKLRGDNNDYRGLELGNRLKVLLISDPNIDVAAATLNVNVGNLSDPDELPGLAHFCEHMLFLGTEKYPEINTFSKFLSKHGGKFESHTGGDNMNFFFRVQLSHLDEALDIFAQFFISPLFTESETDKVLDIIQSEYEESLEFDEIRLEQLDKSTSLHTHPYHNFGAGNRKTLETVPRCLNIDVRKELLEFYYKWFSSNIMSLVVLGKQTLDELETMVASRFSNIEDKSVTRPTCRENPFPPELCGKRTYCVPVGENTRKMIIVFPIPEVTSNGVAWCYLSYLIGHEGAGSLYHACASRSFCDRLDVDTNTYHGFSLFKLHIDLTEKGLSYIDDIIDLIFQYLAVLKAEGPKRWVFEELTHIFSFYRTSSPQRVVMNYVDILQDFPMENVLTWSDMVKEWDPKLIMEQLSLLTPANMRVMIAAKEFSAKCTMVEPWYGTMYFQEDINESLLMKWSNPKPINGLHMPPANEFLPTDFTIIQSSDANINVAPTIVKDTPLMRVWYKHDTEFQEPDGYIQFDIRSPLAYANPMNRNVNEIWVLLLLDYLRQYSFATDLAGLQWDVLHFNGGINVIVEGLSDKQPRLLERIMEYIVTFNVNHRRFNDMKKIMIEELQDADSRPLDEIAGSELKLCLTDSRWTIHQRLKTIKAITPEMLNNYTAWMLRNVHIEGFIYGNFTKERAIEMANLVEKIFPKNRHPVFAEELLPPREIKMERGAWYIREIHNNFHKFSSASVYYACGLRNSPENVILKLLADVLKKPCEDMLKRKTGADYKVFSSLTHFYTSQGLFITVNGWCHPKSLDEDIESFIEEFLEQLENMPEEEFLKHKKHRANVLLCKFKITCRRAIRPSLEIFDQIYNFNREKLQAEQLNTVTKDDLIQFYKKYLIKDAPERRKISIHIVPASKDDAKDETLVKECALEGMSATSAKDETFVKECVLEGICATSDQKPTKITNLLEFQSKQSLYPRPTPFIDVPRKGL